MNMEYTIVVNLKQVVVHTTLGVMSVLRMNVSDGMVPRKNEEIWIGGSIPIVVTSVRHVVTFHFSDIEVLCELVDPSQENLTLLMEEGFKVDSKP